jgi:hypothetical protein
MARQAICISHATGADGEAVGRAVAERLGFRYVDDDVIAEAAEWAELDPALVADAERRRPLVARLLAGWASRARRHGSRPAIRPAGCRATPTCVN